MEDDKCGWQTRVHQQNLIIAKNIDTFDHGVENAAYKSIIARKKQTFYV